MKYKLITLLALLSIAGCDLIQLPDLSRAGDNFTFIQNYGYCDTVCIGESVILAETNGEVDKCVIVYVTTGLDTLHGLNHYNIVLNYNLQNTYSVDFGNGQSQIFNNNGTFEINWKCNRTYEVIICYE